MCESKKKQWGLPIALLVAGAGLGAYLVVRRKKWPTEQDVPKRLEHVLDACKHSLDALENRLETAAG